MPAGGHLDQIEMALAAASGSECETPILYETGVSRVSSNLLCAVDEQSCWSDDKQVDGYYNCSEPVRV